MVGLKTPGPLGIGYDANSSFLPEDYPAGPGTLSAGTPFLVPSV